MSKGTYAYPQSKYLFGGFQHPKAGSAEVEFNTRMLKVRDCVEWGFKEILVVNYDRNSEKNVT